MSRVEVLEALILLFMALLFVLLFFMFLAMLFELLRGCFENVLSCQLMPRLPPPS